MSIVLFSRITEKQWEQHEESIVPYVDLKASIEEYNDENVAHRDQTNKLVETTMSTMDRRSTTIKDLYQGLNVITKLLKDINNDVKDDPPTNKKIDEAIKTFAKISTNTTEILSLVKDFDAGHFGDKIHDDRDLSGFQRLILFSSFKQFPPTQAQPITTITTHPESSQAAPRIDKGKGIAIETDEDPSKKLVPVSTIVRLDPDEEVKVPYMINGKMYYLTDTKMQAYLDKEEKLRKAVEEARLLAISKPEVIKVVQEEAKKIELDLKKLQVPKQVRSSRRLRMLNTKSLRESTLKKLKD
ncbi:hypothetical protein Tco_1298188 [Tanacetum coccineum]